MNDTSPLVGLIGAFDAEAARVRDRAAVQTHAPHGTCPGGLTTGCTASKPQANACTGCGSTTGMLVPWAGERLCMDCTDTQLDLLALATRQAPVTTGRTPVSLLRWTPEQASGIQRRAHPAMDTDALAEAIVTAIGGWVDGDPERLAFAEEWVSRTPLLEGSPA